MSQRFFSEHWLDADSRPAGGVSSGSGFTISWQNGALQSGEDRKDPNGAFVEDVISAAVDRLKFYQRTQFRCDENATALSFLLLALEELRLRTANREQRGVDGTHAV